MLFSEIRMELTSLEARIIGCLLEKEITTPDQYPLSLNALTMACNQKTSREPVMSLSETDVQQGIDSLNKKRLISEQSGFGSRVIKYKHRFCNTEFSDLQLSPAQVAIVCLLLLRGAQTSGELRTRSTRLYSFSDIAEVEITLNELQQRQPPLAMQLPKIPGKREIRFRELVTEHNEDVSKLQSIPVPMTTVDIAPSNESLQSRVDKLEQQVAELIQRVESLS